MGLLRRSRRILRALKRLARDEDASSEIEWILLLAGPVFILFVALPPLLISAHGAYFDRIVVWINLPFP